jgi:hypothetical protein
MIMTKEKSNLQADETIEKFINMEKEYTLDYYKNR